MLVSNLPRSKSCAPALEAPFKEVDAQIREAKKVNENAQKAPNNTDVRNLI